MINFVVSLGLRQHKVRVILGSEQSHVEFDRFFIDLHIVEDVLLIGEFVESALILGLVHQQICDVLSHLQIVLDGCLVLLQGDEGILSRESWGDKKAE